MKIVVFDFNVIANLAEFYALFARQFSLSTEFSPNLDAVWDMLTGGIELPIDIRFVNFTEKKRETFTALISLFVEAQQELEGGLRFTIVRGAE